VEMNGNDDDEVEMSENDDDKVEMMMAKRK
jgi:hypothetical protein